jgi:hypothetical protein
LALKTEMVHNVFVPDPESLSRAELIALLMEQQQVIERLQEEVEELRRGGSVRRRRFPKVSRWPIPDAPGASRARGCSAGGASQSSRPRKWCKQ